ncbi:MAG: siroheme decarboxylase subunit beta [Geminicoccaceae bacterium]
MGVNDQDKALLAAIEDGLPLVARPFAAIANLLGCSEHRVIARLQALIEEGAIKRFGVVVRHRALGYRANAMIVFDIPDKAVPTAGAKLAALPFVTLCYRRPRRPPAWPYNLFCMIHGRDEAEVRTQVSDAAAAAGIVDAPHDILFSRRCFKQRGARYRQGAAA